MTSLRWFQRFICGIQFGCALALIRLLKDSDGFWTVLLPAVFVAFGLANWPWPQERH